MSKMTKAEAEALASELLKQQAAKLRAIADELDPPERVPAVEKTPWELFSDHTMQHGFTQLFVDDCRTFVEAAGLKLIKASDKPGLVALEKTSAEHVLFSCSRLSEIESSVTVRDLEISGYVIAKREGA